MIISPLLLIDSVILSVALTITLVLRAKGNTPREEKEIEWILKKFEQVNNKRTLNQK